MFFKCCVRGRFRKDRPKEGKGAVTPVRHPISRETHVANKFTDLVFEITALKSTPKIVLWVLAQRADENGPARHIRRNMILAEEVDAEVEAGGKQ
jgi:hypothetical protein